MLLAFLTLESRVRITHDTPFAIVRLLRTTENGGEGGIRTLDTVAGMPVFKTGPFNHSGTSPFHYELPSFHNTRWLVIVPARYLGQANA